MDFLSRISLLANFRAKAPSYRDPLTRLHLRPRKGRGFFRLVKEFQGKLLLFVDNQEIFDKPVSNFIETGKFAKTPTSAVSAVADPSDS